MTIYTMSVSCVIAMLAIRICVSLAHLGYTCIGRYIHGRQDRTQDRHTVRGVRDARGEMEQYKGMHVGWFNIFMIFTLFCTCCMTFENCKNIYSWQWFLAVARKLVLVSHSD
jgi:hypothetical protein